MINIELQQILKNIDPNYTIYINSSNNYLSGINNQRLDFIEMYGNNFDDNEVDRVEQIDKNIYLSFSRESLIIPQVYYFYLKWREYENIQLKSKICMLSSTYLSALDISSFFVENKINCLNLLNEKFNFLSSLDI